MSSGGVCGAAALRTHAKNWNQHFERGDAPNKAGTVLRKHKQLPLIAVSDDAVCALRQQRAQADDGVS